LPCFNRRVDERGDVCDDLRIDVRDDVQLDVRVDSRIDPHVTIGSVQRHPRCVHSDGSDAHRPL